MKTEKLNILLEEYSNKEVSSSKVKEAERRRI